MSVALLLLCAICAGLLTGCGSGTSATRVVRVGYLSTDMHQLAYYVAREKGFFTQEGLDVREVGAFSAGPEEMSAFSAGQLDMGYVGAAPAITFASQGMADIKIVAQANTIGSSIVVRPGLDIADVNGLKGRTVAIPGVSTMQDFILHKALDEAGVDPAEVNIIVVKPPDMIASLASGQIDAAVVWEPYPTMAVAQNAGRVLITSAKILPDHPCCMVVVDSKFLKDNPDTVKRFIAAHIKATDYINANKLEAADMAHLWTGQDTSITRVAMKNIKYAYVPSVKAIQSYVDFMKKSGVVKQKDTAAFTRSLVDTSFTGGSGR
jgi:NitT/TauT family transport system substrate-binding protein